MDKVSIIIPVYNAYSTIDKCIESIMNQTYRDFELILINDGSTDQTLEKLDYYEDKYENVRVINKENEGVSKTRNLGIQIATGKYIMFIDNDDYIDSTYVETLVKAIQNKDVDCIYSGFRREDSNGKVIQEKTFKNTIWSTYLLVVPWAKIYDRKYLLDNNIEFLPYGIGEDIYFTLKLISSHARIEIIDYIGYTWFFNTESVSNTSHKGMNSDLDILYLLNKIKTFASDDEYTNYFFYRFCVWYLLYSGRNAQSEQFLLEAEKYKQWLKKNNCYNVLSPFSSKLAGESLKDRLIVFTFKTIDRLSLLKPFSKIYCRGNA